MKSIKLLIINYLIAGFSIGYSQNLIPNPSFEDTSACPTGFSQVCITGAYGDDQVRNCCPPWMRTTCASPDYYNQCNTNSHVFYNVGVPNNSLGFQVARTGQGYMGVITFDSSFSDYKEYISAPLDAPLEANKQYYAEMFVSLSDGSEFASDKIGMCFTYGLPVPPVPGIEAYLLNNRPQIANRSGNIISDTLNWFKISGTFRARGGENYVTIGNFNPDSTTLTVSTGIVRISSGTYSGSYYYIEDVALIPCPPLSLTFSVTGAAPGQENGAVKINISGGKPPYYYSIDSTAFQTSSTFTSLSAGTYHAYVVDSNGCSETGTFSVNPVTGVKTISESGNIKIYPTPFSNELHLFVDLPVGNLTFIIFNLLGEVVYTDRKTIATENTLIKIDLLTLSDGMYFIELITDNGTYMHNALKVKPN